MVPFVYDNLKVISTGLITSDEDTALMWRGLMLSKALEQFLTNVEWGDLDYLIIDLPPGTGDIQMALSDYFHKLNLLLLQLLNSWHKKLQLELLIWQKEVLYRF